MRADNLTFDLKELPEETAEIIRIRELESRVAELEQDCENHGIVTRRSSIGV